MKDTVILAGGPPFFLQNNLLSFRHVVVSGAPYYELSGDLLIIWSINPTWDICYFLGSWGRGPLIKSDQIL